MRRACRHGLTLGSVVSLVIGGLASLLWVRSYLESSNQLNFEFRGTTYTLSSAYGYLCLARPPQPVSDVGLRRMAEQVALGIRNDQFFWVLYPDAHGGAYVGEVEPFKGTAAARAANRFRSCEVVPPLMAALNDPHRCAAAHLLLSLRLRPVNNRFVRAVPVAGRFLGRKDCQWDRVAEHATLPWMRTNLDGLTFVLDAWVPKERDTVSWMNKDMDFHAATGKADAAQIRLIRDLWHRRLDVPLASLQWKYLLLGITTIPAWQFLAFVLRRRGRVAALRVGHCVECGYDLRAHRTGQRCPECGTVLDSMPTCVQGNVGVEGTRKGTSRTFRPL